MFVRNVGGSNDKGGVVFRSERPAQSVDDLPITQRARYVEFSEADVDT